ncbi:MAG: interleukin-like EMT inducer domain-containing protein [Anaerolineae bacterium]
MRRIHLLALLLYSLLAVALTWPLAAQITTHVPGSDVWAYDEYTFLWNIWYFKHTLIDQLSTPLHTDLIFYPLGMGLVMYTFNLVAAALALPIHLATGNVPLASNLINLASTALAGYGAFLLALYLLRSWAANNEQSTATIPASPGSSIVHRSSFIVFAAAFIAGLIYAFASSRMVYLALGHYMIVTTQWLPFFLLYFMRTLDRWRVRDAAMAGLFAALCLLTDMLFGVMLALMAGVLLLDWWLSYRRERSRHLHMHRSAAQVQVYGAAPTQPADAPNGWRRLGRLAIIGALAALLSAPLLIPTLAEGLNADYAVEGWGMADQLSADLVGLVTPTDLHPLWGSGDWEASLRAVQTGDSRFSDVNTVFVGYATLALAVLGAIVAGRRARPWLVIALIAFVLALGPLLQINGQSLFDLDGLQVTVPLPYILLHYLPFVKGFRAPNRFSLVLLQAMAVLAGYGAAWLLVKVAGTRPEAQLHAPRFTFHASRRPLAIALAILLSAAILFEHLAAPMPLTDARVPAPYAALAEQPGDWALLQLPMGWRNGFGVFGAEDTRVEWYQTVHGRPILGGNTSRNPAFKFEYFQRLPLLQAITGIEMYQPPDEATDQAARASAAELMALWNVRYLAVNPPVAGRYPYTDTWQATQDYALDVIPIDPQPVWDADGVQIYAVQQAAVPFPFELDLGSRNTDPYRGPGWSVDEDDIGGASGVWVDGREAELYLPLRFDDPAAESGATSSQPVDIVLRVQPFAYPGAPQQTLSAEMNSVDLGTQPLQAGWQELRFHTPAEATVHGLNRLRLRFSHSARPIDVLPDQGMIGATGVQAPVDIEINSGGAAQDFAFMTVTDPDGATSDVSAGRRGYNLAAIDPKSDKVLDVQGFDTYANAFEANRMAQFIEDLPNGVIVLGAARGEAGVSLNDRAVAALASLGSAVDLRATPGYGHAFVGVKGATPGAAAEQTGPDGAYLRIAADRRELAAAVDWVRLEAAQ